MRALRRFTRADAILSARKVSVCEFCSQFRLDCKHDEKKHLIPIRFSHFPSAIHPRTYCTIHDGIDRISFVRDAITPKFSLIRLVFVCKWNENNIDFYVSTSLQLKRRNKYNLAVLFRAFIHPNAVYMQTLHTMFINFF